MKRILIVNFLILFSIVDGPAQKRGTPFGDVWVGNVVAADEKTREITIEFTEKGNQLRFTGVAKDGSSMTLVDGSHGALNFSEIPTGMRVQLYAKRDGQKVYRISRVEFLGKDEHARLRALLKVDPDLTVERVKSPALPLVRPLKIYAQIESPSLAQTFQNWTNVWNEKQAAKHGAVEVASTLNDSDISVVVYGRDLRVLDPQFYKNGQRIEFEGNVLRPYNAFLVRHHEGKLEILWKGLVFALAQPSARGVIEKELENKLKATR